MDKEKEKQKSAREGKEIMAQTEKGGSTKTTENGKNGSTITAETGENGSTIIAESGENENAGIEKETRERRNKGKGSAEPGGSKSNPQVYLKLNQISEVQTEKVKLKDIAKVFCQDTVLLAKCNSLTVKVIHEKQEKRFIGDVLEIIEKINQIAPKAQVDNLGETDYIIDYRPPQPSRKAWQWIKTIFVCIISFCGAAFAIMTFNNDVDVPALFHELYWLVMGKESNGFTVLEASYSIGLSLGILVFFNHFMKWKLTEDPTPLEVQMRTYEDDICKTLIQNNGRKEKEVDVT